jgi:small subunit ribosomal protein S19
MSRSSKKGPFLDPRLERKLDKLVGSNSNKPVKTWARGSTISPRMVGMKFEVHNGRHFIEVFVTESMVGHKLGEFALTRKFNGHSKKGKIAKAMGSTGRAA